MRSNFQLSCVRLAHPRPCLGGVLLCVLSAGLLLVFFFDSFAEGTFRSWFVSMVPCLDILFGCLFVAVCVCVPMHLAWCLTLTLTLTFIHTHHIIHTHAVRDAGRVSGAHDQQHGGGVPVLRHSPQEVQEDEEDVRERDVAGEDLLSFSSRVCVLGGDGKVGAFRATGTRPVRRKGCFEIPYVEMQGFGTLLLAVGYLLVILCFF